MNKEVYPLIDLIHTCNMPMQELLADIKSLQKILLSKITNRPTIT